MQVLAAVHLRVGVGVNVDLNPWARCLACLPFGELAEVFFVLRAV
jgi:hypothetical protein